MESKLEKIAERMSLQILEKQLSQQGANWTADNLRTTDKVVFELVTPFSSKIAITEKGRTIQTFDCVIRFALFKDPAMQSHKELFKDVTTLRGIRAAYVENLNSELSNEFRVSTMTEEVVTLPYDAKLFGIETKFAISEIQNFECICLTPADCS